jgi:hypothetical protein
MTKNELMEKTLERLSHQANIYIAAIDQCGNSRQEQMKKYSLEDQLAGFCAAQETVSRMLHMDIQKRRKFYAGRI